MGFADLHVHTIYSYDGRAAVPAVLASARDVGPNVIAITDHDEIKGAVQACNLATSCSFVYKIPGVFVRGNNKWLLVNWDKFPHSL